ncbi:MAG: hypothetical protein EPO32_08695 [Anaerolineae bacterium]|nr:MAG: hypothetical protein EPO32_08695 [Anaerolineae bacterium]
MNLNVNEVFEIVGEERNFRILAIPNREQLVFIDINDPSALPSWRSISELSSLIERDIAKIVPDPYAYLSHKRDEDLSEASKRKRATAWKSIESLVKTPSGDPNYLIFDPISRGEMIRSAIERDKSVKPTLYKWLRRWLQRGQILNALLPDYSKSGGKGKQRKFTDKKPGKRNLAESIRGEGPGIPITSEVETKLYAAYRMYKSSPLSVPKIYNAVLGTFFNVGYEMNGGIRKPILPHQNDSITLDQFRYIWKKLSAKNPTDYLESRYGKRAFNTRFRPIRGSAFSIAYGPGSRYQIDTCYLDCYAVSKLNRKWVIGRPWLYVVMDTFSGLVVGFYLTLEQPSWIAAALALDNAFSDKTPLAETLFGIKVNPLEVPALGRCQSIIFDRGEGASKKAETIVSGLGIRLSNLPPYRPDWKPIVESIFHILNQEVVDWLPGSTYNLSGREGKKYRHDAVFTMDEIREILFIEFQTYNLTHEIDKENYPFDPQILAEGLITNPLDLWHWGITNRTGILRSYYPDTDKIGLLPRANGSISREGIHFSGRKYISPKIDALGLRISGHSERNIGTSVIYDPRNPRQIYVGVPSTDGYEVATLHPEDSLWGNYEYAEWLYGDSVKSLVRYDRETMKQQAISDRNYHIQAMAEHARSEQSRAAPSGGKVSAANSRKTRAKELEDERVSTPFITDKGRTAGAKLKVDPSESTNDYVSPPKNLLEHALWDEEIKNENAQD